jgi:hypothetical protein
MPALFLRKTGPLIVSAILMALPVRHTPGI